MFSHFSCAESPWRSRVIDFLKVFVRLGVTNGIRFKGAQYRYRIRPGRSPVSRLRSRLTQGSVELRNGTSDWRVFHQVFVELQYGIIPTSLRPTLIVDAGANVGLSACYLLSRFPGARLIAVEPDDSNLRMARQNLLPYGDRAILVRGAVWSESTMLELHQPADEQVDHWAIQAHEARGVEPGDVQGFSIEEILAMAEASEGDRILLKMDIEGAERCVFSAVSDELIDRFAAIAIELHGEEAAAVFFSRMNGKFTLGKRGETTYAERLSPAGS